MTKVFGRDKAGIRRLIDKIKRSGLKKDIIFSYGGDGTYLLCERKFPGIPKILIKKNKINKKCGSISVDKALRMLNENRYSIKKNVKIELKVKNKTLVAVNDIVIRNKLQYEALRFNLFINSRKIGQTFIGDGLIISTPFGSGGYFSSCTRKTLSNGLGIAFNNTVEYARPLFINDNSEIKVKILRGEAYCSADNNHKMILLKKGGVVNIKKSKNYARLVEFSIN
jgi:NAD kinase